MISVERPNSRPEESCRIPGPAGMLEARLGWPERPGGGAVVCHPHPLHGGTMDNKVVYILCSALRGLGLATVRFNYRGVGDSAGEYDEGRGETEDALAVAGWLQGKGMGNPLWLAGFSFGGGVALRAHIPARAERLILVAPSLREGDPDTTVPTLVAQGDADEVIPLADTRSWVERQRDTRLEILNGADHFFHGRLTELRQCVQGWVGDSR